MTIRLPRLIGVGLPILLVIGTIGFLGHTAPFQTLLPGEPGERSVRPRQEKSAAAQRNAAVPVTSAEVRAHAMPITVSAVGTVQPIASIPIRTRLDSMVLRVAVEEGAQVKAGDLLFVLDDSLLKAQLAQVDGQIAKDDAQIAQATRDLARADDLVAKKIDSPVQRDTAETALKALQAQRAADLGQRQNILAQLAFTEIRAPISGRIGAITAKAGAIIRAADTSPIATLNQIDPIYVATALPQTMLPDLKAAMAAGPVDAEAIVGSARVSGKVTFVDNAIDAGTGTVMVRSSMKNGMETLWPGAFVRVTLTLGVDPQAITVPLAALQAGQSGPYVFIVDANGRAIQKAVKVARNVDEEAVISSGLVPGDRVVTSGQLRIATGVAVLLDPAGAAAAPGKAELTTSADSPASNPN